LQSWGQHAADDPRPPTVESRFDLASLTKPIVASLALRLDRAGLLPITARVGDIAAGAHASLARRQLGSLLRHRAGLAAWTPLMLRCRTPDDVRSLLLAGGEVDVPAGETRALHGARAGTYSDLGYILWGLLAEEDLGEPLSALVQRHVTDSLGMCATGPAPGPLPEVVACDLDNGVEARLAAEQGFHLGTEKILRHGTVQDGNARFLAEIGFLGKSLAGHAGLFGSAQDLLRLARAWLDPERFFGRQRVARALGGQGPFSLGWARRRVRGSAGAALSAAAFGHTGFTGGSLWMDPAGDRTMILLSHRQRSDSAANPWRRDFHVWAAARCRHQ
jgi:CubicO group peptidase (beta-lactamase class C family)